MDRTLLVATDGTSAADGALRLGAEMGRRHGYEVHVLGVVEPVPVFDAGFMVALPEMELYDSRKEALERQIRAQLLDVSGVDDPSWHLTVEAGVAGSAIIRRAEELKAEFVFMGLGRHQPMDRIFGTETVLQAVRISHLPIFAVPEKARRLPRSALMGVDFSVFSQRAARAAVNLMDPPWEAHLAHVLSGLEFLPSFSANWRSEYESELQERLAEVGRDLPLPEGSRLHFHLLEGEPSRELLAFAKARDLEMLVVGSHGHSFVGRLLMGSVSTRVVRSCDVPTLIVPPPDATVEALPDGTGTGEQEEWVAQLKAFTQANAGRRTTLEIDDPDLGVQECGRNFPLWGVDYHPRQDRVNIMLGGPGQVEGHLTHSIAAPQEISIALDESGNASALLIRLRSGQVILRINR
jgi:nucleotide-binding universal stress UspA family protein